MFPATFHIWDLNSFGKVLFYGLFVTGCVLGAAAKLRGVRRRAVSRATAGLFVTALAAHALTAWVLFVDPYRDSGNVPLPQPFALAAEVMSVAIVVGAPHVGGVCAGFTADLASHRRDLGGRICDLSRSVGARSDCGLAP
jgi:hypothetical protein